MTTDNVYMAIGNQEPGIGVVDCRTGHTRLLMLPADNCVCAIDVCVNDEVLACGTATGCGRVYSLSNHDTLEALSCLYVGRRVIGIAVYPGLKVITQDTTGRVISWRLDTEIRFAILPQKQPVQDIVKMPNGLLAGVGENMIHLWDTATEELIGQLSLSQAGHTTDAVFWAPYNQLIVSTQSGLYALDSHNGSCRTLPGCAGGYWRLFTSAGNLYALETQSGMLCCWSGPESDVRQTLLCRGVTDVAMAGDQIVVIDNEGSGFQYGVSQEGLQYAGRLPWRNCQSMATVADFERMDYQQNVRVARISQIRTELDHAVSCGDSTRAQYLTGELRVLGEDQDAELLQLKLAKRTNDIAGEIEIFDRMISGSSGALDNSMAERYLELLIGTGQLDRAIEVYDQFKFPNYQWMVELGEVIDNSAYVIEPTLPMIELLKIYCQLEVPLNNTFLLHCCESLVMPDVTIMHTELADKLSEIGAKRSMKHMMGQTLTLHWQSGNKVAQIDTLTLAAFNSTDSYVLIPALRFFKQESGTVIEPAVLFSACCQEREVREHNDICLTAIKQLEQKRPESLWPDYLRDMISEALIRLRNTKQTKKINLGGLYA